MAIGEEQSNSLEAMLRSITLSFYGLKRSKAVVKYVNGVKATLFFCLSGVPLGFQSAGAKSSFKSKICPKKKILL